MKTPIWLLLTFLCHMTVALAAIPVLIRDATVHTISTAGTLEHADILIRDGKVADIGRGLAAPAGTEVIEAAGRPVTPGLFGGLTHLGLEEISLEPTVDDFALHSTSLRPEFDVTVAFNADSVVLGVNRILAGVTFAMLTPSVQGSIVAGQGAIARLDGTIVPGARALFVEIGGNAAARTGESRAAQLMLLRQTIDEVREPQSMLPGDRRLLSPAGRRALSVYLDARGPMVFSVDRASDIRRVIAFAHQEGLRAVIKGGAGAWRAADELAAARIPVILNPFDNLPVSFDAMAATVENAVRLNRAGVKIAFSFADSEPPHYLRRLRQAAGVAVAHGLPWDVAMAALTRNPAEIFGVAAANGSLVRGRPADLVLWSGDPLELASLPDRVFIQGESQIMRSRQTELRDRYLARLRAHAAR